MFIAPQLQNVLSTELESGETLLWTGRPDPLRMLLHRSNLIACVFGIVWTVNAVAFIQGWPKPDFAFYLFTLLSAKIM